MSLRSSKVRKPDFMLGSERMLRAHHKNAVFHKSLEDRMSRFDESCNKKLSKVQQDIYDVYFNEYIPLKEESDKIRQFLPRISNHQLDSRWRKLATIPGNSGGSRVRLPQIHALSLMSSGVKDADDTKGKTDSVLELLRQQELERTNKKTNSGSKKINNKRFTKSPAPYWDNSDDDEPPSEFDEKRLQIIKTAIALTSQPPKPPEPKKPKRLRRSFLISLRRDSILVLQNDLLNRIPVTGSKKIVGNPTESPIPEADSRQSETAPSNDASPTADKGEENNKTGASKQSSEDVEGEDEREGNDVISLNDNIRSMTSMTSDADQPSGTGRSLISGRTDAPLHDIENDLYMPDSSPDLFSMVSEGSDIYTSDSDSELTGSELGSDSMYSYYSDDN